MLMEARRISRTMEQTPTKVPLTDESFFVCNGYPGTDDLHTLGDHICKCAGTDRPWRSVATWLSETPNNFMSVDILLATWLCIHATSISPLPSNDKTPLNAQEKFRLAEMLWTCGPTQLDDVSCEKLRLLTPTISWSTHCSIESMVGTLCYLQEPMSRTIKRMRVAWNEKKKATGPHPVL